MNKAVTAVPRFVKNSGIFLFLLILLVLILRATVIPPLLEEYRFSQQILDRNGELMRLTLSEDGQYRVRTSLDQISSYLIHSTLLYEDEYFYYHFGVNIFAIFRAAWKTFVLNARMQGASTITMQLARMKYKLYTRNAQGKLLQILAAIYLEVFYSKSKILEAYLNLAPYGFNIQGVGAASLIYLKTPVQNISLVDSISLTLFPQNPVKRSLPLLKSSRLPESFLRDRNFLWKKWLEKYPEDKFQAPYFEFPIRFHRPWELPFLAPHTTNHLLKKKKDGKITSSIDLQLQFLLERVAKIYIEQKEEFGIHNTSILLLNKNSMEVEAALGSVNFYDQKIDGQVNGVMARRSPGSALKPFIYGLAIDQGLIHPNSTLTDAPKGFGAYNPENFDGDFEGPISATEALIHSRNLPAIQLASQLENPTFYEFLRNLNIPLREDPGYYGLSIALGSAEVSMVELVQMYAALGNGGKHSSMRWTTEEQAKDEDKEILSPEASFLVLDMLSKNPSPDYKKIGKWLLNKKNVAWKTGTSNGLKDAWAVGVFDRYVMAVWIGNFSGNSNPSFIGRSAAGPLFFKLVDAIIKEKKLDAAPFSPDLGLNIKKIKVCSLSGKIPNEHCPHLKGSYFIPALSPINECFVHRPVLIDNQSGMRSCRAFQGKSHTKVYEFWPSNLQKLFVLAGLPRRKPPQFHPSCKNTRDLGFPPQISSPKEGVKYKVRIVGENARNIPLIAISDADVKELTWYVDSSYLGKVKQNEAFFWRPEPGVYSIRVVDDLGRSDEVEVKIDLTK